MAFWTKKTKDDDMAKKSDKSESAPAVEEVVSSAPAPATAPIATASSSPTVSKSKSALADLVSEFSACASACRHEASRSTGIGAHVMNVQADVYEAAAAMARGKM